MCILFVYVAGDGAYPELEQRYRLVIASNRDEFLARPAARCGRWADAPRVVAGRDAVGGGTWLGLAGRGGGDAPSAKWAALTNVREPAQPAPDVPYRSRGRICADFLRGDAGAAAAAAAAAAREYDGYNALFGDGAGVWYATNRGDGPGVARVVEPGIHVLSNASLDTPWPKSERGRARFAAACAEHAARDPAAFARALLDDVLGDDAVCALATGTGCTEAHEANFCYVHVPLTERLAGGAYGTRTSTAVLVAADGGVTVVERDRADGGWAEQALVFPAGASPA